MDILYTVLAVTVSLLSVFGAWCAIKFPIEAFFSSGKVVAAVELNNEKDAEMLDVLLHEAHSAFFRKGNRRIVVLIDAALLESCLGTDGVPNDRTLRLLDQYGAVYRVLG